MKFVQLNSISLQACKEKIAKFKTILNLVPSIPKNQPPLVNQFVTIDCSHTILYIIYDIKKCNKINSSCMSDLNQFIS